MFDSGWNWWPLAIRSMSMWCYHSILFNPSSGQAVAASVAVAAGWMLRGFQLVVLYRMWIAGSQIINTGMNFNFGKIPYFRASAIVAGVQIMYCTRIVISRLYWKCLWFEVFDGSNIATLCRRALWCCVFDRFASTTKLAGGMHTSTCRMVEWETIRAFKIGTSSLEY